jgi:hypothetical protein
MHFGSCQLPHTFHSEITKYHQVPPSTHRHSTRHSPSTHMHSTRHSPSTHQALLKYPPGTPQVPTKYPQALHQALPKYPPGTIAATLLLDGNRQKSIHPLCIQVSSTRLVNGEHTSNFVLKYVPFSMVKKPRVANIACSNFFGSFFPVYSKFKRRIHTNHHTNIFVPPPCMQYSLSILVV